MDGTHIARVRFLAGEDAWAAWLPLVPTPAEQAARLDMAVAEYGDLRLVAAYVLDSVADKATGKAAEAAVEDGEKVKRFRVEGKYEEEYFAPGTSPNVVQAGLWRDKATALRNAVTQEQQQRQLQQRIGPANFGTGSVF